MDKLLSVAEAAELLGVSGNTLRHRVERWFPVKESLLGSERVCSLEMDRDLNAAKVLRMTALRKRVHPVFVTSITRNKLQCG